MPLLTGMPSGQHPSRLPLLRTSPLAYVPSPLPRRNDQVRISLACLTTATFPDIMAGRLPRRSFRGLHSVHSRYGPHALLSSLQRSFLEVLQAIRRLLARSKCFRPEREWPGGYLTHGTRAPSTRHTQRTYGELLGKPQDRVGSPSELRHSSRGGERYSRIHRGVL